MRVYDVFLGNYTTKNQNQITCPFHKIKSSVFFMWSTVKETEKNVPVNRSRKMQNTHETNRVQTFRSSYNTVSTKLQPFAGGEKPPPFNQSAQPIGTKIRIDFLEFVFLVSR